MKTCELKFLLLGTLILSFIVANAQPVTLFGMETTIRSESSSSNRILYLNDSYSDLPKDLLKTQYLPAAPSAEIRRIEVENDTVIVCANSTVSKSTRPDYMIFFDTNNDSITDFSLRCTKASQWFDGSPVDSYSCYLYRYEDKAFYWNGSWHTNCASNLARDFGGKVEEKNSTTGGGETHFHLHGIINGTVRIKVVSMVRCPELIRGVKWKGDLVPGSNFTDGAKLNISPPFTKAIDDVAFPYSNNTVELDVELPPPPPPPPPPEEPKLNLFAQMIVWSVQAAVWVKESLINLPSWMVNNAVSGGIAVTLLLLSSYSLVKKWRIGRQRLKRMRESLA